MPLERRSLLMSAGALLVAACAPGAPGKTAPSRRGKLDPRRWNAFKTVFMKSDGRIVDTGAGGISHSEGQGYGMLLAQAAGDRAAFDRIHGWTEKTLARSQDALFSWRYDPAKPKPVDDPNNASDGDMLIAWALMRAGEQWSERRYHERAAQIRAATASQCVRRQDDLLLLLPGAAGFVQGDRVTINLSYYIWPALDAFRAAGREDVWPTLIRDGEKLIDGARSGPLALPTDWTDVSATGALSPAADKPARFGFDAVRIPLYLMLGGRTAKADAVARFWRSYVDEGKEIPAWVDVLSGEIAPYALSKGGYAVAGRLLKRQLPAPQAAKPDYYSEVLGLLTALAG